MKLYNNQSHHWLQINYRYLSSLLGVQFIFDLYDQFVPTINVYRYRNVSLYFEGGKMWSYAPEEDWKFNQYWLGERFKELDPDLIAEMNFYINREKKALHRLLTRINAIELETLDNSELAKLLNDWYYTTLNDIFALNLAPVEHALTETLKALLNEIYDKTEVDGLLSILLTFEQYTEAAKEEMALIKLVIQLLDGEKSKEELLLDHMRANSHLTLAYGSKEWTYDDFEIRVDKLLQFTKPELIARLDYMLEHPERVKNSKSRVLDHLGDDRICQLAEIGAGIGYLRDKNKALLGRAVNFRNRIINVIEKKMGVTSTDLNLYFLHEILELLLSNTKVDELKLRERESGIVLNAKLEYLAGDDARYHRARMLQNETYDIEMIKGLCASPGEIRGRVRICRNPNDCQSFIEGEVLVAHGTDFDFIDAMMKASAIITEEGGILSHAAVVSREIEKPCIVGMKGVLSCLKNGDEIMINALKGKVKILSPTVKDEFPIMVEHGPFEWEKCFLPLRANDLEFSTVGGKAYNLAKLLKQDILVPEGIVASKKLFHQILVYNGMEEEFMDILESYSIKKVTAVERLISQLFFPVEIIQYLEHYIRTFSNRTTFAVRSSGIEEDGLTESFAGIHHTSLYCGTVDEIVEAIKRCWCSFYGNGSMTYRKQHNNEPDRILLIGGVIIQEMVDADLAGVLFTANPITGAVDELVIESCKGVANKLVSGSITPCTYLVSKADNAIVSKNEGSNLGRLNSREIVQFTEMVKKLGALYSYPLDVEWAIKDSVLYIIQARPITTLQVADS